MSVIWGAALSPALISGISQVLSVSGIIRDQCRPCANEVLLSSPLMWISVWRLDDNKTTTSLCKFSDDPLHNVGVCVRLKMHFISFTHTNICSVSNLFLFRTVPSAVFCSKSGLSCFLMTYPLMHILRAVLIHIWKRANSQHKYLIWTFYIPASHISINSKMYLWDHNLQLSHPPWKRSPSLPLCLLCFHKERPRPALVRLLFPID